MLLEIRKYILEAAPNATRLLNYNIPAFLVTERGKRDQQVMIGGYKAHMGLYPHPATIKEFEAEIRAFKKEKHLPDFH